MRNERVDFSSLMKKVGQYLDGHDREITHNQRVYDAMILNPSVQRLMSIWLQANNEFQLNALFNKMDELALLSGEAQERALSHTLQRAQTMDSHIGLPKELKEIVHIAPALSDTEDRWSDLNRAVFECSQQEIEKLNQYAVYINNGIMTANTVLNMNSDESKAFEDRVAFLIKDHASYIAPYRIFTSDLIKLLQSDTTIIKILSEVQDRLLASISGPDDDRDADMISSIHSDQSEQTQQTRQSTDATTHESFNSTRSNLNLNTVDKSSQATSRSNLSSAVAANKSSKKDQDFKPNREFYPGGINDKTFNQKRREHLHGEKKIHKERDNRDPKGLPNWHVAYMKNHPDLKKNLADLKKNDDDKTDRPSSSPRPEK